MSGQTVGDRLTSARRSLLIGVSGFAVVSALSISAIQSRGAARTTDAITSASKGTRTMGTIKTNDGSEVFYKDWGSGPIVMLSHGWPLNADAWEDELSFLASPAFRDAELLEIIAHLVLNTSTNYANESLATQIDFLRIDRLAA